MEPNNKKDEVFEMPIFGHIGLLSKDLEKTIALLDAALPMGPWKRVEATFSQEDMAVGIGFKAKVAVACCGDVEYEIVQAIDSPDSYIAKFVEKNGECIHHVAYIYQNELKKVVENMLAEGYKIIFKAIRDNGSRVVYYLEPKDGKGMVFELTSNMARLLRTN